MKKLFLLFPLTIFLLTGCSGSEETMEEEKIEEPKEEIYVFDEVPEDNTENQPTKEIKYQTMYAVQIGAFTTLDAAQEFEQLSKKSITHGLKTEFSDSVGLFIVYVNPFSDRKEAEKLRNELWKKKEFADAFVLIVDIPIEE